MRNRVFGQPEPIIEGKASRFAVVSRIAFASGFPFHTYVSRAFLREYTISGIPDDDEGELFVEAMIGDIVAALGGELPATSVSYGRTFSLSFDFPAQHRQRSSPEVLTLFVLFGPWEWTPEVWVWVVPEMGSSSDALDQDPPF
jgi:hypothetical protein